MACIAYKASLSPKFKNNAFDVAKTASGNNPSSSITKAIRSKPNEIPTPLMFFNPKIPVKSS